MSESNGKVENLLQKAQTLGEEGNLKDAIAMYDQAYDLLCNGASYRSSPNMQSVNPEENRLTSTAHLMTSTAILEAHTVSDDAIARFERAAELALTGRRYGIAMHALFLAKTYCRYGGKPEKATQLGKRIEDIKRSMPGNLEGCIAELKSQLTLEFQAEFESKRQKEIVPLYRKELYSWLENNWCLWEDSPLKEFLRIKGARSRNKMVDIILIEFHRHLKKASKAKKHHPTK